MISSELQYRLLQARLDKFTATRNTLAAILADDDMRRCQLQLTAFDFEIEAMRDELASFDQAFDGER